MSKRTAQVLTEKYGRVNVELITCEECRVDVQPEFMVGWFRLEPQGILVPTMGSALEPLDFCGLTCLHSAVVQMNGGTPSVS